MNTVTVRRPPPLIALMLCWSVWPVAAARTPDLTGLQRVRSDHALIANLVAEGQQRSKTFRQIVLAIEATDGVVYIEPGKCHDGAKGCLLHKMSAAGEIRYLWIAVNVNAAPVDLMVRIAHELRHALEILSDASIRTGQQMLAFYQPRGIPSRRSYETAAALAAGAAVRDELGKSPLASRR